jgi:hypothetical protein
MRSLIIATLLALPLAASASRPMPSVREQVKKSAQAQGLMRKGSGQRLSIKVTKQPTLSKSGLLTAKVTGLVPGPPRAMRFRGTLATADFRLKQNMGGRTATGIKRHGQVWDLRMFALGGGLRPNS